MGLPVQRERSDVESGTPEPFSPEMLADPYPAYSAMRERGRIQRTAAGHWLVLGYDEVSQLLTDQRFGEAAGRGGRIRLSRTTREGPHRLLGRVDTMLSVDPPEHTRLRRLVSKAFTPRSVQKMRPLIQEIVNELLDGLDGRTEFDLVSELAWPLPVIVIAEMLGIPRQDRERFKRWSDAMVATLGGDYSSLDEARRSNEELVEYVSRVIAARRRQPQDDLISRLVAANRDPSKYADPDSFDVARNPTDHVAFGDGIHFCLGAALARLEGQIAIGTLLRRFPNLQLLDDQPEWAGTSAIRGVTSVRLRQ